MVQLGSTGRAQLWELGVAVFAFPCCWVGMGPCGLYSKIKGPARWNWSGKSVLPFPSRAGNLLAGGVSGKVLSCGSHSQGCGVCVFCWRGTGRENTVRVSCCQQDSTEEESLVELFWAAFAGVELLGLPLCSSRQKVERLVMQYLSTGSDSPLINLLLMLLRFCQGFFFFLQATQSRSEKGCFHCLRAAITWGWKSSCGQQLLVKTTQNLEAERFQHSLSEQAFQLGGNSQSRWSSYLGPAKEQCWDEVRNQWWLLLEMSSMSSAAPRAGTRCAFAAFPGPRLFVATQTLSEKVFSMWEPTVFVSLHSYEILACVCPVSGAWSLLGFVVRAKSRSSLQSYSASCRG